MELESSLPPQLTLSFIFSETKRVLKAQPRLLLMLSLIFLAPLSIAAAIFPIFYKSLTTLFSFAVQHSADFPTNTLLFVVAYFLFITLFSTSAIGTITYSAIQAFNGQTRINLESAIKSLSTSFFPLLATSNYAQKIIFLVAFVPSFILSLLIIGAISYGYEIDVSFPKLLLVSIIPLSVGIFLQVNWTLSSVVVVAETTSGSASLKRSWSLVKGRRWLVFTVSLCSGLPLATLWGINLRCIWPSLELEEGSDKLKGLIFLLGLQVFVFSTLQTMILLFALTARTVLYMYCNKSVFLHVDEKFDGKYISLTVNDKDDEGGQEEEEVSVMMS